jgi:hypothetical protein
LSGPPTLSPWAVDATNVYYASYYLGSLIEQPLDGGSPLTLATGQVQPFGMAVDATRVYWIDFGGGGTLNAVPIGGGPVDTLATGPRYVSVLSLDGNTLVFGGSTAGPIMAMSTSGTGLHTVSATDPFGELLLASGGVVYGLLAGEIEAIGENGGAPTTMVTCCVSQESTFAVSGSEIYWGSNDVLTECDGGVVTVGSVVRATTSGGSVTTLVSGLAPVLGIAVDATSVYWSADDGTISKAPR